MSSDHGNSHSGREFIDVAGSVHGSAPGGGGGHDEGEGSWLVSYADMMTLLVGFFVILMSFSSVDQEKFDQIRKEATKTFGGTYQQPFADMANQIKGTLDKRGLGDQFVVKESPVGVDISFLGTVFFNTGEADIKPEGLVLLRDLLPVLKTEASGFDVMIEGHTDDVPLAPKGEVRSNWELSSLRACRVLSVFEQAGFPRIRLTAVGYGEARPIVPNRDAQGVPILVNMSQNRRVVIKLIKRPAPLVGAGVHKPSSPAQ